MSGMPYITCKEVLTFHSDYLSHELPEAKNEEFERHLSVCEACVAYIVSYEETIRMAGLACSPPDLRVEEIPPELLEAILASRDQPK